MKKLREYIRKELTSLIEARSYPVPAEIRSALKGPLQLRPLKRFIRNLKTLNTVTPAYRIFLHNGKTFDIFYLGNEEGNFKVKINNIGYDLLDRNQLASAIGALDNLLTDPIMPKGDEETTEPAGGDEAGGTEEPAEEPAEEPEPEPET